MAEKKEKQTKTADEGSASTGYRVENTSTTTLVIGDVKLHRGRDAFFPDFNPEDAKYKAWTDAGMLRVTPA